MLECDVEQAYNIIMKREIVYNGRKIEYELEIKKVKNVNMRIKPEGVFVSASRRVPTSFIDSFVLSRAEYILSVTKKFERQTNESRTEYFTEDEVKTLILSLCRRHYAYFSAYCPTFPLIRFKDMTSRWGSCMPEKRILTFNTKLRFAPHECVEYVVLHEFTHFIEANHSPAFYSELEKVCPRHRELRAMMKKISAR